MGKLKDLLALTIVILGVIGLVTGGGGAMLTVAFYLFAIPLGLLAVITILYGIVIFFFRVLFGSST